MTTEPAPTVAIDGEQVPVDDCIWLERYPCDCIVAAVVARVPGEWTITTADEALRHFNRTDREYAQATRAGHTASAVTGATYRSEFSARWHCAQHAPAPSGAA
jgi:hypothetical protein